MLYTLVWRCAGCLSEVACPTARVSTVKGHGPVLYDVLVSKACACGSKTRLFVAEPYDQPKE